MTDKRKDQDKMAGREPLGEAELEALFAAARRRASEPSADFLSAILADAAEASAARAVPAARPAPRRKWRFPGLVGGWRGVTALTACALVGFWLGQAGLADFSAGDFALDTAGASAESDQVGSFFDLALAEG